MLDEHEENSRLCIFITSWEFGTRSDSGSEVSNNLSTSSSGDNERIPIEFQLNHGGYLKLKTVSMTSVLRPDWWRKVLRKNTELAMKKRLVRLFALLLLELCSHNGNDVAIFFFHE